MKKGGLPALVQLAIVTLLTTVLWVGFEIYRAIDREPEPAVSAEVLQQINPTLDQVALDRLVNRITLEDAEIGDTVITDPNITVPDISVEVEEETQDEEEEIIIPDEDLEIIESTESAQN